MVTIFWFRRDLRISDNPGFLAAVKNGNVLPVYILDDASAGDFKIGAASRWWLHHSLLELNKSLDGKLNVYIGDSKKILTEIVHSNKVDAVYWNRCYEPFRIKDDSEIKTHLKTMGLDAQSFNASLLWEQKMKRAATKSKALDWVVVRNRLSTLDAINKRNVENTE